MGRWRKLGQICGPLQVGDWATGFAAVPTAVYKGGDIYRIYVSARDDEQRSRPGWIEYDLGKEEITDKATSPILPLGDIGAFDDSGVMPTWVLPQPSGDLMYYIGWNRGVTVPFRNSIGAAQQQSDGSWRKLYTGPIQDRTRDEPHFIASCAALQDGNAYHIWYLSCTGWTAEKDGAPEHRYHIKYASAPNPIDWQRSGAAAIDFLGDEYAISRPSVLREEDGSYRMWFSARGDYYRIFEATSTDGRSWQRAAQPVLTPSDIGWDAQMVCYPHVFDHSGARFILFNGNGYGRTGVGLAVWEG